MSDIKVGAASITTKGTYPVLKNHDTTVELTSDVVSALQRWLNSGRTAGTVLLVGGPRSMEFLAVLNNPPVIICTSASTEYNPFCEALYTDRHVYHRVPFGDKEGYLPFEIYEHSSIRDANVNRRIEQINTERIALANDFIVAEDDVKIAKARCFHANIDVDNAKKFIDGLKEQLQSARNKLDQTQDVHVKVIQQIKDAKKHRDNVSDKLTNLEEDRRKIYHDHGI